MNLLLRFLPVTALFFLVVLLSPGAFAQSLPQNIFSNPQSYKSDGTNNITSTVGVENQNPSFVDLRWILPILLIAAVIALLSSRKKVTKKYYNPNTGYEIAYSQIKRKHRRFKRPLKAA